MNTFTKISEIEGHITDALGDFAADHDIEAIAREVSTFHKESHTYTIDEDSFWDVVAIHALA